MTLCEGRKEEVSLKTTQMTFSRPFSLGATACLIAIQLDICLAKKQEKVPCLFIKGTKSNKSRSIEMEKLLKNKLINMDDIRTESHL